MTLDPQALKAAARAYCEVIGLDYDRISGLLAAKRDEATAAAITAYLETVFPPKTVKLTRDDERLLEQALAASTTTLYPILPADTGWQDISTAPKDGTTILACDARVLDWHLVVSWDPIHETHPWGWRTQDGANYHDQSLTHWMPLPPPPVGSGSQLADANSKSPIQAREE